MTHGYSLKTKSEIINEPHYMVRTVELKVGTSIIVNENLKIPRTPIRDLEMKLHEVYLEISAEKIKRIDEDNRESERFVFYMNKKMSKDKANITVTSVYFEEIPSQKILEEVLDFFLDIVYRNFYVKLFTPPKLIIRRKINGESFVLEKESMEYYMEFLKLMQQKTSVKPLYFIPTFTTRKYLPDVMKLYIDTFGPEGLFVIDMNGGRFTYGGYSIVGQVMRVMKTVYKHEDYGIYLFNHKSRKRSGKEVPSEDLIAILNGVNFVGSHHGNIPLPPHVLKKIGDPDRLKILNDADFLYYPYDIAPNKESFHKFLDSKLGVRSSTFNVNHVNLYNDTQTNHIIRRDLSDDSTIRVKLSSLKKDDFKRELEASSSYVFKMLKNESLNTLS